MKRTALSILLALLFLAPAPPESALGLEIVYPADRTYVLRSDFLVIKGGEPTLDGMTVEIGGVKSDIIDISSPDYSAAFGDVLHLAPDFDAGVNRIVVEGYVGDLVVAAAEADIYYLAGPTSNAPERYRPFVMHLPEKEALCAPCHNLDPAAKELRSDDGMINPCASCHRSILVEDHVHGPAGVYDCLHCHERRSSPSRYAPREGDALVCNECHFDKVDEFKSNKYVHGPVEAGLCLVCHDAHGSATAAQLVAPVNELCLGCHDSVGKGSHVLRGVGGSGHPLEGERNPADPRRKFTCVSCHDPHGGKGKAYFQGGLSARFALCQRCHKK